MCLDDDCNDERSDRRSFLRGATASVATLAAIGGRSGLAQTPPPPTRVWTIQGFSTVT